MPPGETENYVVVPNRNQPGFARLYHLGSEGPQQNNSFLLLPYANPQAQKVKPRFFPVDKTELIKLPVPLEGQPAIQLKAKTSKAQYINNVLNLKRHIQQGNIYEINYCVEFFAEEVLLNPLEVFAKLDALAKAPYSILLKAGHDFIICASPELFLKKEGSLISTKPIKGTIRRGTTAAEDVLMKNTLFNSLKERTENVMAVDVARNDLSHFAQRGTVNVNKLYNIETFETVHQMVSTISCEMKDGTSLEELLSASFPMASMTGAPKITAMNLIDEFEDFNRESYSGAMGFLDENGDFSLSVVIRSIFYNQKSKRVSLAVGGAITYLSDPEKEYEECLLKAGTMLKALGAILPGS